MENISFGIGNSCSRPIGEILNMVIQITKEQNLIGEPCSWHFSQFDLIKSARYDAQLYVFPWFAAPLIASSISSFMSDDQPKILKHIDNINVFHFTEGDSIELICKPFEFFPLWDDPVNFSNKARFLELTGT